MCSSYPTVLFILTRLRSIGFCLLLIGLWCKVYFDPWLRFTGLSIAYVYFVVNMIRYFRPWEDARSTVPPVLPPIEQASTSGDNVNAVTDEKKHVHHLDARGRRTVLRVYDQVLSETGHYGSLKRTALYTGYSISTVQRVIVRREHPKKPRAVKPKFSKIDDFTKAFIERIIKDFYEKNISPTAAMIYTELTKDGGVFPYTQGYLYEVLKDMGYRYSTLSRRQLLMDTPRLINLRDSYLIKLAEYQQLGKQIFYLDETWYDTHDVVSKGWTKENTACSLNVPASRGKRIIILHAGSESGWVDGALLLSAKNIANCSADYHEDMTSSLFERWFEEKLLQNIPIGSIIIMDNASYHSRQKEVIPCTSTRKGEIQSFLDKHGITYPVKATKKVLLQIISEHTFEKKYYVDEKAKEKGCKILRLPPYYCILNPIEMMWGNLKRSVRQRNNDPKFSEAVLNHIRDTVDATDHLWMNCCRHVRELEEKMKRNYGHPPVIINVTDNDSDSETNGGS